jgi:hypothetical protein
MMPNDQSPQQDFTPGDAIDDEVRRNHGRGHLMRDR